jgi:branched-chain amino acid transport system substrate-binding protein
MQSLRSGWRYLFVTAIVLAIAIGVAGCGGGGSSTGSSSSSGSENAGSTSESSGKPIVVGAALASSGLLKGYDVPSFNSFKLKANEINAEGGIDGHQIKIVSGNTQSDISRTPQVAEDLISEGAEILLVSCDFDFGSPAALVAQKAGMVSISVCAVSPKFGAQAIGDKAYTFTPSIATESAAMATFAKEKGWDTAYLLDDETLAYSTGQCSSFEKFYPELGGEIIGKDSFKNEDSNFSVMINHLKAANPSVIELCSYPPGGASLLRQIRAAGIDAPVVGGSAFDGTFWLTAVPNLSDFYISTTLSAFGDDPDPRAAKWIAAYEKAYGEPPGKGQAAAGYSIAEGLQMALEQTGGSTDGEELKEALNSFKEVDLLNGPTTFTPETHIPLNRPITIVEYKDGKPRFLKKVTPEVEVTLADGV